MLLPSRNHRTLVSLQKNNKDAWVVSLLFLFTGLAIVMYLNQYPYQLEKGYAYVGSFYAFMIWIGIGVLAIIEKLRKFAPERMVAIATTAICLFAVPGLWQAKVGTIMTALTDTQPDFAKAYLGHVTRCILFTMGDNDTFLFGMFKKGRVSNRCSRCKSEPTQHRLVS